VISWPGSQYTYDGIRLAIDADRRQTAEAARASLTSIFLSLKRQPMALAAGKAA